MHGPAPDERAHIEALVRAFVLPRYRERLLLKPRQLIDELCHTLPDKLDPRLAVPMGNVIKSPADAATLVQRVSRQRTAFFLTAFSEPDSGEYPIAEAVELVEAGGSSVASIEPGELMYYKTEGCPRGDSFLLVRDARRRDAAVQLVKSRSGVSLGD